MVVIWFKRTALSVTLLMLVAILMILLLAAFDVIELPHLYSHQWHEE